MLNKILSTLIILYSINTYSQHKLPELRVSKNHRYLQTKDGKPFFWLGDTGWLLFTKLNNTQTDLYFSDRQQKGFNVIQVMILPSLAATNVYGDSALINKNVANPKLTGYWDHIDSVIDLAAAKGLYLALVPIWGNNVKDGLVSSLEAKTFSTF